MEWHLDGPEGPMTIAAATPDEAVEKYGHFHQLEDYELGDVFVASVEVPA